MFYLECMKNCFHILVGNFGQIVAVEFKVREMAEGCEDVEIDLLQLIVAYIEIA